MNFYKRLYKILLDQKNLYVWFIIIMMLPSFALALTEPLSVWVRLASILLPLGVYMIAFNILRKPGYFLLFCFPLLLINGYQLVLIYLFNESVVSPDMFLNIVTTNTGESSELMRTIWPAVLVACIIYFSATGFGIYSVINKQKLSNYFIKKSILWALLPVSFSILFLSINTSKGFDFKLDHDIYPVNALYNLYFAADKYIKTNNYSETSKGFTFNATKDSISTKHEVYILVIGETSRAANWELYGYNRATNPTLSKRNDIIVYKDILTQANITHKIVPMLISEACAENFNLIYTSKSIITAFKEAGFKTAFISNQLPDRAFIDAFASEADYRITLKNELGELYHPYDNEGIPFIKNFIENNSEPLFIIYHTYGSHFEYSQRYPLENAFFRPNKAGALRYRDRQIFMNAYDNSIRNIDLVLNEIISTINKPDYCSAMVYISDHGEDMMDDERKMFLHCSPVPTYYQLHVPMITWFSENYKNDFPVLYNSAVENKDKAGSANIIFHTMLDIASINTIHKDSTMSIVNPGYKVRERFFINEHDEPESYYHIGLKENDWKMIKKMGIAL